MIANSVEAVMERVKPMQARTGELIAKLETIPSEGLKPELVPLMIVANQDSRELSQMMAALPGSGSNDLVDHWLAIENQVALRLRKLSALVLVQFD